MGACQDEGGKNQMGEAGVYQVTRDPKEWEKLTVTLDSGMVDHVGAKLLGERFKIRRIAAHRDEVYGGQWKSDRELGGN